MFNFGRGTSLFGRRNESNKAQARLRRIANATIPNKTPEVSLRFGTRNNRTIPVLYCPYDGSNPDVSQCRMAITKDISDQGVSLILSHPATADLVVVGFQLEDPSVMNEPWFFRGRLCRNEALGGGFWVLAVELFEFANGSGMEPLEPLIPIARKLLPSHPAEDDVFYDVVSQNA